ncbi:hypothetical protein GCM10020331_092090 [Ectobacillus funiculus]
MTYDLLFIRNFIHPCNVWNTFILIPSNARINSPIYGLEEDEEKEKKQRVPRKSKERHPLDRMYYRGGDR